MLRCVGYSSAVPDKLVDCFCRLLRESEPEEFLVNLPEARMMSFENNYKKSIFSPMILFN